MSDENDPKYSVGYCKPPKHTQFKPGVSGNPRGRPRKSTTFEDEIERELKSTILVSEGSQRGRITKRRAIVKQQVNRAMRGDQKSTELVFKSSRQTSADRDNLDLLIDEFREKNRRLQTNQIADDELTDPAKSESSTE